jgi:dTDP-4-amino-4,6-dideoxygalactose transaminase
VVTNDDALAATVRKMVNFGFAGPEEGACLGINGKMSEVSAAMGLTGLESLEEFTVANRRNYHQYKSELSGLPGIHPVIYDEAERCNYQYIVLEVDETASGLGRDRLIEILQAENVMARRYFYPGCHQMEPYRSRFPDAALRLPMTNNLARRTLALPNGISVGVDEVRDICGIIRIAVTHSQEVSSWSSNGPPYEGQDTTESAGSVTLV